MTKLQKKILIKSFKKILTIHLSTGKQFMIILMTITDIEKSI